MSGLSPFMIFNELSSLEAEMHVVNENQSIFYFINNVLQSLTELWLIKKGKKHTVEYCALTEDCKL